MEFSNPVVSDHDSRNIFLTCQLNLFTLTIHGYCEYVRHRWDSNQGSNCIGNFVSLIVGFQGQNFKIWSHHSAFPREDPNHRGGGVKLLFSKIFAENCMKMKEIGPGARPKRFSWNCHWISIPHGRKWIVTYLDETYTGFYGSNFKVKVAQKVFQKPLSWKVFVWLNLQLKRWLYPPDRTSWTQKTTYSPQKAKFLQLDRGWCKTSNLSVIFIKLILNNFPEIQI